MKFIKKPIIISAEQFLATKKSFDAIIGLGLKDNDWYPGEIGSESFKIKTLEGNMTVNKYDWVIKGIKGEFYPCKPDIFEMTYEKVEE